MENNNEKIGEIVKKKDILYRLKNELKNLNETLKKKKYEQSLSKRKLDKEFEEFQKMEGFSFQSIFHSLKGSKKEKLEKEKQDYIKEKDNYDSLSQDLKELRIQVKNIETKIDNLNNIDEDYKKALSEKENYILSQNNEAASIIKSFNDKIEKYKNLIIEIQNVYIIGQEALGKLGQAQSSSSVARAMDFPLAYSDNFYEYFKDKKVKKSFENMAINSAATSQAYIDAYNTKLELFGIDIKNKKYNRSHLVDDLTDEIFSNFFQNYSNSVKYSNKNEFGNRTIILLKFYQSGLKEKINLSLEKMAQTIEDKNKKIEEL